ncbi:MAG: flagellar motor switch protein FliG, partial [Tabrizicola sp.]
MPQDMVPLARINPERRSVAVPPLPRRVLTPRQKAAVIVRYLLTEGTSIPLSSLPEHMQAALAEQMGQMRLVDRSTLNEVVDEFLSELESVGLAFPGGIEGALSIMDGHISQSAAQRLRRMSSTSSKIDPWERITTLPPDRLLPILLNEAVEVGAVMLSKVPVGKAAELLGKLPGERARRVAYAVSLTGNVDPETVRRIGAALLAE